MTPPEWRPLEERAIQQIKESGVAIPWEKEYIHKDGHRVPILAGRARLEGTAEDCICFILDLTERKRAEEKLQKSYDQL